MSDYTLTVHLEVDPADAERQVRNALEEQGFGVLTEIDVAATVKAKLDVDMPAYRILGACNPSLAHQALQADPDIGALLPCNVVVRAAEDGGTDVIAADPRAMLRLSAAKALDSIADDAGDRLQRALHALG